MNKQVEVSIEKDSSNLPTLIDRHWEIIGDTTTRFILRKFVDEAYLAPLEHE